MCRADSRNMQSENLLFYFILFIYFYFCIFFFEKHENVEAKDFRFCNRHANEKILSVNRPLFVRPRSNVEILKPKGFPAFFLIGSSLPNQSKGSGQPEEVQQRRVMFILIFRFSPLARQRTNIVTLLN